MKITHQLSNGSYYRRDLRILLIGSGGNGSAVLFGLPYLHHALVAWGKTEGLSVTVMDGDSVSATNCVRQPFGAADIGQNKATILVHRINLFHGLAWRAEESYFSKNRNTPLSTYDQTIDFVISCVDTRAARREMHEAFRTKSGPWRHVRYWLDLGNDASSGQFVLGQPLNDLNRKSRTRLRTVTELFPLIMDTSQGEGPLPSCSAAEALERQEPFINNVLATSALAMLTRLLRYGVLDHHGAFYNAESGRSVPLPIDPDVWEKQARRRRRLVAAA
ncbi:MAG TPA: PRTRC system ThiF family protein [Edaphobacter sp.]|uniref:PRTRC system ThiF family protein n=1 Tax=Edaphobacter sp. TaxID=1934404 RepID=UPI002C76667C|nr:PRTRC system ThiF family protein [Edaphobacter sp.]HUZ96287.1 PRTRC system ThiF family protein [Edaphobacter sp.]